MAVTYCHHCGRALQYYAEYCPHCGTKTARISTPHERKKNFKSAEYKRARRLRYLFVFWLLLSVFVFMLCLGLETVTVLKKNEQEKQENINLLWKAGTDKVFRYYGSQLQESSEEEYLQYLKIADAVSNYAPSVTLKGTDSSRLFDLVELVCMDYPEYFWYEGDAHSHSGYNTIELYFDYSCDTAEIEDRKQRLESAVYDISEEIRDLSEYEKVKTVYEYLVRTIIYNNEDLDQSCYSVLVEHQGVCAGYASAFNYILGRAGMQCMYVSGYHKDNPHAWNMVNIDGDWYQVDVTYGDDDEGLLVTKFEYDYLLITDAEMMIYRTYKEKLSYPECTSDRYNYYRQEGLYLANYDIDSVQDIIQKELAQSRCVAFKCADRETYEQAAFELCTLGMIFKVIERSGYSKDCNITSRNNSDLYTLKFRFSNLEKR